jgi:hypothetical protein
MAVAPTYSDRFQEPIPQLECLEHFVGTWRISPETSRDIYGCVSFEWMVGGYFLVQHVELFEAGRVHSGVAYIGWEPEAGNLRAIYFGDNEIPLEYEWEAEGDAIAIWAGGMRTLMLERVDPEA